MYCLGICLSPDCASCLVDDWRCYGICLVCFATSSCFSCYRSYIFICHFLYSSSNALVVAIQDLYYAQKRIPVIQKKYKQQRKIIQSVILLFLQVFLLMLRQPSVCEDRRLFVLFDVFYNDFASLRMLCILFCRLLQTRVQNVTSLFINAYGAKMSILRIATMSAYFYA